MFHRANSHIESRNGRDYRQSKAPGLKRVKSVPGLFNHTSELSTPAPGFFNHTPGSPLCDLTSFVQPTPSTFQIRLRELEDALEAEREGRMRVSYCNFLIFIFFKVLIVIF
jgi:hypothetical protein